MKSSTFKPQLLVFSAAVYGVFLWATTSMISASPEMPKSEPTVSASSVTVEDIFAQIEQEASHGLSAFEVNAIDEVVLSSLAHELSVVMTEANGTQAFDTGHEVLSSFEQELLEHFAETDFEASEVIHEQIADFDSEFLDMQFDLNEVAFEAMINEEDLAIFDELFWEDNGVIVDLETFDDTFHTME